MGKGLVVVLRRPDSPFDSARFPLRGLDDGASYRVTDLDARTHLTCPGHELLNAGLETPIKTRPGSALFLLERQ
jgi:hypothetical protein